MSTLFRMHPVPNPVRTSSHPTGDVFAGQTPTWQAAVLWGSIVLWTSATYSIRPKCQSDAHNAAWLGMPGWISRLARESAATGFRAEMRR